MEYNAKNYTEQGGEKTVIRGELSVEEEGVLKIDGSSLSKALYQSDSEATTIAGLVTDFNKLLLNLQTTGIMFSDVPVITILTEPEDIETETGNIEESLSVIAEATGKVELTYQWYSNNTNSNTGGAIIDGAISETFDIPDNLIEDIYYYYCVISANEAESVSTRAITVTVSQI